MLSKLSISKLYFQPSYTFYLHAGALVALTTIELAFASISQVVRIAGMYPLPRWKVDFDFDFEKAGAGAGGGVRLM